MFLVPPPSNVPVATKFTVVPTVRLAVDGEIARLTRRGVAVGGGGGVRTRDDVIEPRRRGRPGRRCARGGARRAGVRGGRRRAAGGGRRRAHDERRIPTAARAHAGRGVDGGDDGRAGSDGEDAA